MATEIVNAFNIFIDTERCLNSTSDGDSINLTLNHVPITCSDNQFIRMSLQNFSAYKSFTNINPNNNVIRITHDGATSQTDTKLYLPCANYGSLNDLAQNLADLIGNQLAADLSITYTGYDAVLPPQAGTSDNIISFTLDFSGNHNLSTLLLRTLIVDGDSYEILGTNRIREDDDTPAWDLLNSVSVDLTISNKVTVNCLYNAQLSSQQNVYLKTDINSTSIQTESFVSGNNDTNGGSKISSSQILGRMIVDNDFINFNTSSSDEYSINLSTKIINHMRLFITDSHGRKIPPNVKYLNNEPVATVGYPNIDQLRLGNRSFEAVLKVEIMQYTGQRNNHFITEKTGPSIPARFELYSPYSLNGKPRV
jgi:hypothetical protein